MTNKKTTKRALLTSVMALFLCFVMLIGSTYAWFTDEVTSGNNQIIAGNLDIEVEYTLDGENWATFEGAADLFQKGLWEPGHTEVVALKISNKGSLALKYIANMNIVNETVGKTKDGKNIVLSDILTVSTLIQQTGTVGDIAIALAFSGENNVAYEATASLKDTNVLGEEKELHVGDSHYLIIKVDMAETVGNEANHDGTNIPQIDFGINILATQFTKENDSFGNQYDANAGYPVVDTMVTAANLANIDFTEENTKFVFTGAFDAVSIPVLGDGSVIALANATIGDMTLGSDATVTGTGALNNINTARNSTEAVTLNITDATLDIAGELGVRNTDNKSVLNIENSHVEFGTIFVGEHTNNHGSALAEFNVINSYLSGEENGLGSTINVWGKSGVNAKIYDSEIYTYSRGWHQSEDANDNAITFQGDEFINVDIQRSNMHLYGARSIVYARPYNDHDGNCEVNFTVDESLIWSVTKSSHGEDTLPVWGATEITDSILLFTKNVHQSTDAVFSSFVYGNPVIHGDYHVTTQCQWDAAIALADGQTVTFAKDANVSIYEGAGNVEFVKNGSAKVVLEDGATVTNIDGLN